MFYVNLLHDKLTNRIGQIWQKSMFHFKERSSEKKHFRTWNYILPFPKTTLDEYESQTLPKELRHWKVLKPLFDMKNSTVAAGLPDFNWCNVPKNGGNVPNNHKMYQMSVKWSKWL
jgi:hypothetical protein